MGFSLGKTFFSYIGRFNIGSHYATCMIDIGLVNHREKAYVAQNSHSI